MWNLHFLDFKCLLLSKKFKGIIFLTVSTSQLIQQISRLIGSKTRNVELEIFYLPWNAQTLFYPSILMWFYLTRETKHWTQQVYSKPFDIKTTTKEPYQSTHTHTHIQAHSRRFHHAFGVAVGLNNLGALTDWLWGLDFAFRFPVNVQAFYNSAFACFNPGTLTVSANTPQWPSTAKKHSFKP